MDYQPNDVKYDDLESLFISDAQSAIDESKRIISKVSNFDSYKDFFAYHLEHSHISTCQNQWQEEQMSIHCFDCAINSSSCVCLDCFLKGNHKGHNYIICPNTVGNCDCGDTSLWKRTGFCTNHQGLDEEHNHPEDYIDKQLQTTLTDIIFKASLTAVTKFTKDQNKEDSITNIFMFILSFLQFGDGFRRLIAVSLTEKIDFYNLLSTVNRYSLQFNELLQQLCGYLMNDQIFKQNFSETTFKLSIDNLNKQDDPIFRLWGEFYYHAFSPLPIKYNIEHKKWNWSDFYLDVFRYAKEFFKFVGDEEFSTSYPPLLYEIISNLIYATDTQPNEPTQIFFNRIFLEILNCGTKESVENNTIIPVSYKEKTENNYYKAARSFSRAFHDIFSCFKFKKELKFDVLIEQLQKLTNISPIYKINGHQNDKLVSLFIGKSDTDDNELPYPEFYYESFHNGASFFYTMPLYDSLVTILGLENICKIKFARFLMDSKYQSLRIKLGIVTLKKILSFITLIQSLTPKNFGLINMIEIDLQPTFATTTVPRYIPVFQLLLGLKCNNEKEEFGIKEFFAYEMAKEFGLFDDFSSENYKDEQIKETVSEMIFSFLYLSLLIVVERSLFNIKSEEFIREQVIFALKAGVTNLNDLSKSYDKIVLDDYSNPGKFNKVLFSVASIKGERNTNNDTENKDISFILKDNVKWKPISAVIPIKGQKSLLNNEISNHPQTLINIQEFEPEDSYFFNAPLFSSTSFTTHTYKSDDSEENKEIADHEGLSIHLNEFLMTPTILAICYHSMRINLENEQQQPLINLNDHLSLNILILITKFLKDKNNNNNNNNEFINNENINYNTIDELITKFRTIVFNYKEDDQNNATLENTLSNKQFLNLLNMKISYKDKEAKSFIEIINEKGQIGKDALNMMSIQQPKTKENKENNNDEDEEKNIKKQRAKKLKEEIMNKYKNMISNYSEHDNNNNNNINISSNSLELTESIDSITSPTCSGLINGVTDVCSICATIKKKEALSYPIFIYQTKFPFIVDKPPLLIGAENEISVTCDDDIDYESDDESENDESNQSLEPSNDTNESNEVSQSSENVNDTSSNEQLQSLAEDPSNQTIDDSSSNERIEEQSRLIENIIEARNQQLQQEEEEANSSSENINQTSLVDNLVASRTRQQPQQQQEANSSNENINQASLVDNLVASRSRQQQEQEDENSSNENINQASLVDNLVAARYQQMNQNNQEEENNSTETPRNETSEEADSTQNLNENSTDENLSSNENNATTNNNNNNNNESLDGSQIIANILNSVLNRTNSETNSTENISNDNLSGTVSNESLEESTGNNSSSSNNNISEDNEDDDIEEQLMLLNQVAQRFMIAREEGTLSAEDFATAMTSLQQAYNNLKLRKEFRDRIRFLRELKIAKKSMRERNKNRRKEERLQNLNKPKRFTAGSNFIVQFTLCQHLIHPKCVEGQYFRCPIDRTVKNGFLPCFDNIDSFENELSDEMKDSINVFLECYKSYIIRTPKRNVDLFLELIKSLSGLIVTFETRIRSLPGCLDSHDNKLLCRNLFLTCWFGYRIQGKPKITDIKPYNNSIKHEESVETRLTVFQRFIKKLIENDEILNPEKHNEIIKEIIKDLILIKDDNEKEKENYLFLRRVILANHFFLKNENNNDSLLNNNEFIEWDEFLSLQNIMEKFNINFKTLDENFELKPFVFTGLPKEFLHFALKPFNFPIVKTQDFSVFNLLDYNYMIENYDDFNNNVGNVISDNDVRQRESKTIDEKNFKLELALNYNPKHYPTALLLIGKFAPEILVIHGDFTSTLKTFYLDKYGSPDVGFSRGEPLFLNEERYERFMDEILSGDFSNFI